MGIFHLPFWGYCLLALVSTHISVATVTIYLHRHQAHRALELHPVVAHMCRFWLWITTATVTKEWVAVHRKHHATVETEEDPHSPQIYGIGRVFFGGLGLYRRAAKTPGVLEKFGNGTPDDWLEHHVYTPWQSWGVVLFGLVEVVLFGWPALLVWVIQMIWMPLFAAGTINGIGHYWGYRNFEVKDASRNIIPWGILAGGEELHNNHHAYSTSAKMAVKWWEFDIGWFYIRLLAWCKLAKVRRLPQKMQWLNRLKEEQSLKTLLSGHWQVMTHYHQEVIKPVLRQERLRTGATSKALFKRAKKLLQREHTLLNENARQRLATLLAERKRLQVIYDYRLRLQGLWERSHKSPADFYEAIHTWCQGAEATSIKALRDFAEHLRQMVPTNVAAESAC